LLQEKDLIMPP